MTRAACCATIAFVLFSGLPLLHADVAVVGPDKTDVFYQHCVSGAIDAALPLDVGAQHIKQYRYRVLQRYPHDSTAFTQGLLFYQGTLYESTGLLGRSSVRTIDLKTGRPLQQHKLADGYFGEGLAVLGRHLIQLTWRREVAFIYDVQTLQSAGQFSIDGEGWGSTAVDGRLVISNGSSQLRWLTPPDFNVTATTEVKVGDQSVTGLNELEYIHGYIYANLWPSNCIIQIDPASGQVIGWIDLSGLLQASAKSFSAGVLNGIAYRTETDELFVTGKFWPSIYQIELQPAIDD